MCAAVIASRSAAMRAGRRSDIRCDRKKLHQTSESQFISIRAKAANHGKRCIGQRRATPLRLARIDVGEMNLHEWNLHSRKRVANGEARVAVRSRIYERAVCATTQGLNRLDDVAF